jgi:hypothetical protein
MEAVTMSEPTFSGNDRATVWPCRGRQLELTPDLFITVRLDGAMCINERRTRLASALCKKSR